MNKNKKGFTLVELLVTIGIIVLLFGVAVPSFIAISNNIKQKNYENKLSLVRTKAEEWASDTGRTATNVAHLIQEGYLEADNEYGEYKNPVDNSSMLCKTVRISIENQQYIANITEEEFCDYQELEEQTSIIRLVKRDEQNTILSNETWTRGNVNLEVVFQDEIDSSIYQNYVTQIEWKGSNPKEVHAIDGNFLNHNTYQVSASQFLNARYEVTVTLKKDEKTYVYKAYADVKIDHQNPAIYQSDISVDHFDEWQNKGKTVRVVSSDFNGSGIYGTVTLPKTEKCPTTKESYQQVTSMTFDIELLEGDYAICVMDQVGNVSEPSFVTVLKTDIVIPTLSDFSIVHFEKGNRYYRSLDIQVSVSDDLSGPQKLLYCFGDESCEPDLVQPVNEKGLGVISFQDAAKESQKLCVVGVDRAGNQSTKKCTEAYYFDNTVPVEMSVEVDSENHYHVTASAIDQESDLYQYQFYLGENDQDFSLIEEKNGSQAEMDFSNLKANQTYYLKVVFINNAGGTSEKIVSFHTEIDMNDAVENCDPVNGFCNKGIYLKYGGNTFVLYKISSTSNFGLNVSNNMRTSIINDFCCDQGTCIEQNVYNTAWSGIYSEGGDNTLKVYYNRLPNPTQYLNLETYTFGAASSLPSGRYIQKYSMKARYGLLDLGEYWSIYQKSYMKDIGTLLSTVFTVCLSSDHYECNNDVDNITGIYALNGTLRSQSAVTGAHHNINVNAAMTVPFQKGIVFIGGSGTISDPYVVA